MKISLIIASYNPRLDWLSEALASAAGLFHEIIVVDDGSDRPIQGATIRKPHGGVHTARNVGISAATGDVIAQLDDDDRFIPRNVVKLKQFIEAHDSDLWHFPITRFGEEGNSGSLACVEPMSAQIYLRNLIPSGAWFRRKVWEELNGYRFTCGEDWDFWARAFTIRKRFVYFPLPIYEHRVRYDSLSYREGMADESCVEELRKKINTGCNELRKL